MLGYARHFIVFSFTILAVSGQAVIVNFDSFSRMNYFSGNPIPSSARLSDQLLVSHGVRFSSTAGYVAVVELGGGHATSGVNGIGGSTAGGVLTYNSDDPIWVTFHTNADPNSLGVTDFVSIRGDLHGGGEPGTLEAYDPQGNLIGTLTLPDIGGQTWSFSLPNIHAIRFLNQPPGSTTNGIALDDLEFNTVVPEPATILGLVAGIQILYRRRKTRAE